MSRETLSDADRAVERLIEIRNGQRQEVARIESLLAELEAKGTPTTSKVAGTKRKEPQELTKREMEDEKTIAIKDEPAEGMTKRRR